MGISSSDSSTSLMRYTFIFLILLVFEYPLYEREEVKEKKSTGNLIFTYLNFYSFWRISCILTHWIFILFTPSDYALIEGSINMKEWLMMMMTLLGPSWMNVISVTRIFKTVIFCISPWIQWDFSFNKNLLVFSHFMVVLSTVSNVLFSPFMLILKLLCFL